MPLSCLYPAFILPLSYLERVCRTIVKETKFHLNFFANVLSFGYFFENSTIGGAN